ncbi:carnitine dehydratase [Marivirga lumbricoides]|uniref:Carnitine dehydratase n=1 Tax=Marivirga lumbricoides TaxID=1046115 RepID=A0A2T4DTI6_9BACT|nr:carnitine dehydratase [Marivirga lumbricoides]
MNEILKGVRVLELANVLAGPSVGQFLAESGAQVIKIENPATRGDVTRSWKLNKEEGETDVSAYFSAVNSGKLSVALDVQNPDHYAALIDLVKVSDIVIASYKMGDAEKLRVDAATFRSHNRSLIYGKISGYGDQNSKVGYDAILQAETGFMFMNGEPGGKSVKMPVALIDILAAHQLKEAILLAYIHRLKTGKGAEVSVSLFDAAISSLANQATNYLLAGHNPKKMGSEHPNIAPYGSIFTCQDGAKIVIAVGTDKQFEALTKVLGLSNLMSEKFSNNSTRVKNREQLNALLQNAFAKEEASVLLTRLDAVHVPSGKLQSVQEVFASGKANHLLIESGLKTVGLRNFIAKMDKYEIPSHIAPPPSLNQHANYLFTKILGYSEEEKKKLE